MAAATARRILNCCQYLETKGRAHLLHMDHTYWGIHRDYYSALETGKPMDVTLVSAENLPVSGRSLQSLNTVMGDKHQGDLQSHRLRDHQVLRPSSARQLLLGYTDCVIHANLVCPLHTPSVLSF